MLISALESEGCPSLQIFLQFSSGVAAFLQVIEQWPFRQSVSPSTVQRWAVAVLFAVALGEQQAAQHHAVALVPCFTALGQTVDLCVSKLACFRHSPLMVLLTLLAAHAVAVSLKSGGGALLARLVTGI